MQFGGYVTEALIAGEYWAGDRSRRPRALLAAFQWRAGKALLLFLVLLLARGPIPHAGVVDFDPGLLRYIADKWGQDAQKRLLEWQAVVRGLRRQAGGGALTAKIELDWVEAVNRYWNRVPYADDYPHWGVQDYWATPVEMLASNAGDCEDYAIGKYFTLKELGVPVQKMRITYVRKANWNQPHMVLAYYAQPDADPLILDNLDKDLLPASKRPDLEPVYSFNDDDLWTTRSSDPVGKSSQIRLWRDVLEKMRNEQNR